jgi:hypothetical protein
LVNGPIPDGHHIHHICENKGCVRPDHLEAIPEFRHRSERGFSAETRAKISAAKTGKKWSAENRAKLSAAHAGVPWSPARWAAEATRKANP